MPIVDLTSCIRRRLKLKEVFGKHTEGSCLAIGSGEIYLPQDEVLLDCSPFQFCGAFITPDDFSDHPSVDSVIDLVDAASVAPQALDAGRWHLVLVFPTCPRELDTFGCFCHVTILKCLTYN